jgi:PAS domain S-box-containing protein
MNGKPEDTPAALPASRLSVLSQSLISLTDDAVIITDAEQRIVFFNEGAEQIFGHTAASMIGQPLGVLLPVAQRNVHVSLVRDFGQSPVGARRVRSRNGIAGLRADGTTFAAEASIARLEFDGRRYFAAILRDVTELAQAKTAAEAAAAAKSMFLANMSHEIRTPLNAILGMTSLLLGTRLNAEQVDYARTIHDSSESLRGIVDDILDYSKAEVGKLEIEHAPFDLRALVESSLDQVAPRAAQKQLALAYLIEDGTPEVFVGDAMRLRQALLNLLSNAVKFTHEGEVSLIVESLAIDGNVHTLHIAVHDTGIGIAAEHLPRLFHSFTQVDASTTRKFGGTGLGLAITKRLAELMGGELRVDSELDAGSTFHLTVRLEASKAPTPASTFVVRESPALIGRRVLIVEENQTNRRVLTKLALRWGMHAHTFATAVEALDRIHLGDCWDLAVLDAPTHDGLALAQQVRHCSGGPIPLALLAPLGQRPEPGLTEQTGAMVVTKPLKARELHDVFVLLVARAHRAASAADGAPARRLRVLVAEDNLVNQRVVLQMLDRLGFRADVAADGLQAMDAVERGDYDVILMDIHMPEVDGLQAARWVAQRRGEHGRPRLVAMSATAPSANDRKRWSQAGFDDHLAKPLRADDLQRVLDASLARIALPPAPAVPRNGVIDPHRIDELRALQGGAQQHLLRDLIDLFESSAPAQMQALAQAVQEGRPALVRERAHRLLSATQNIGAVTLSQLCESCERLAKAEPFDGAQASGMLGAMHDELAQVRAALAGLRGQMA